MIIASQPFPPSLESPSLRGCKLIYLQVCLIHWNCQPCQWSESLYSLVLCRWLPRWLSGKESAWQCWRCGFDPWVRKIPWRGKWQPTPVFLPEKSRGQRSLAGCSPWVHKELDMTEHACTHPGTSLDEILPSFKITHCRISAPFI